MFNLNCAIQDLVENVQVAEGGSLVFAGTSTPSVPGGNAVRHHVRLFVWDMH